MESKLLLEDLMWKENELCRGKSIEVPSTSSGVLEESVRGEKDDTEPQPLAKKRRGRPNSLQIKERKRTRESERVKKCPEIMTYDVTYKIRCLWSKKDKINFLKGLEEFGPNNVKGLQTYLPNKTEGDIKNQIRMWSEFARIDLQKKLPTQPMMNKKRDSGHLNIIKKLEEWTEHFEDMNISDNLRLNALSNVFLLIAEYGKFSPPSELNGIDLRAMYRYVHCMLNGIPYHGVNKETARMLSESIEELLGSLKERKCVANLQPHLFCLPIPDRPPKTYNPHHNRRVTSMSKSPENMLKYLDFNPLNIPPSALTNKHIELDDDDDDYCNMEDVKQ